MSSETKRKNHIKIKFYPIKSVCVHNIIMFTTIFQTLIWLTIHIQIDILLVSFITWLRRSTVMKSLQLNIANIVFVVFCTVEKYVDMIVVN